MLKKIFNNLSILYKIILVATIPVLLFSIAFAVFIIPSISDNIISKKKEKLKELTEVCYSVIETQEKEVREGKLSLEEAQNNAINIIQSLRYQENQYFWINDLSPKMIMHPYKPELNGKDLSKNADPNGTLLFVEMVKVCKADGYGFVNYVWEKPGQKELGKKLSYVQLHRKWGWIVGTGIYIDDLELEISNLQNNLALEAIIFGLIALVLAFFVSKFVTKPIKAIVDLMISLSNGDLTQKSEIKSNDELGNLRDSVNSFIDSLRKIVQNVKQAEETLSNAASQLAEASDNAASSVTEVSSEITNVASATEQLSANINNISATAEEMSVNAKNVARNSERLEETTSSVASAIVEMSISIKKVSKSADEESSIAKNASEMSSNATITMKNLGIAANEIGKVTEVIKRIAEQTNLLALNATIEAASAGDAGKGFAVVANEIKELANQSAKAAEDIASRITGVQKNTSDAISIINDVSGVIKTLNEFAEITQKSLEQQNHAINDIASITTETQKATKHIKHNIAEVAIGSENLAKNTAESATGANQISASIHAIDETTNNISATSEEVNISANHLKLIADELKLIITQFKI